MNISKMVRDIKKCQKTDPPKHAHFTSTLVVFDGLSSNISSLMILGDGWQMLMVTEEQDHEYLENGKRYQKMSTNRPPKTYPFYVYISHVLCPIFIIWRFSRDFKIQNSLKWSI